MELTHYIRLLCRWCWFFEGDILQNSKIPQYQMQATIAIASIWRDADPASVTLDTVVNPPQTDLGWMKTIIDTIVTTLRDSQPNN